MKRRFLAAALLSATTIFTACSLGAPEMAGTIAFAKGGVFAVRQGQRVALKSGDHVRAGDRVETDETGAALMDLHNGLGIAEVQPLSVFLVKSAKRSGADLSVLGGNVWLKVNKLAKNERLDLQTPTTVAGVRGTCFYTFTVGDISGTCQCEGKTSYSNTISGQVIAHDQDSITFTRGGRVVVLAAADLAKFGLAHHHSVLDDSPIGPKQDLDPKAFRAMMKVVEERFTK